MESHLVHSPLLSDPLEEIVQQVFGGGRGWEWLGRILKSLFYNHCVDLTQAV